MHHPLADDRGDTILVGVEFVVGIEQGVLTVFPNIKGQGDGGPAAGRGGVDVLDPGYL